MLVQNLSIQLRSGTSKTTTVPASSNVSYTQMCLDAPSKKWGNLCPADFALLGNFKVIAVAEDLCFNLD